MIQSFDEMRAKAAILSQIQHLMTNVGMAQSLKRETVLAVIQDIEGIVSVDPYTDCTIQFYIDVCKAMLAWQTEIAILRRQ